MKKNSILILLILFLQITVSSQSNFNGCTIGVASGSATQDGRPLAWKTRDFDSYIDMKLRYNTFWEHKYIMISPLSYFSTTGLNEHGLVIFMSNAYDLEAASSGPGEQQILKYALGYCRTIDEFQEYLDSTNVTGRSVTGNFALIDSTGAAAIFEVAGYEYWRFDAEDEPDGYIIRTNFTVNGGGTIGIQRFNRSSTLVDTFHSGDSLNHKSLIRYHMRDFSNSTSQPYPVPFPNQIHPSIPYGYFPTIFSICNNISTSTAVIQGVLPDEKPELSTLWAMLGQPAAAIAVPYWPVGETPSCANGTNTAPLCDIALMIKDLLFDFPDNSTYINSYQLKDMFGGGLWTCTFPTEDLILENSELLLNQWRDLDSIPVTEMLEAENELAETAYNSLLECYSFTTGNESITVNQELILYPNPARTHFSLVLQPGIEVTTLEIINIQGKIIKHQKISNHNVSTDISYFPNGLYFIRICTSKGIEVKKLIIK